jgi:hypothetical protein
MPMSNSVQLAKLLPSNAEGVIAPVLSASVGRRYVLYVPPVLMYMLLTIFTKADYMADTVGYARSKIAQAQDFIRTPSGIAVS